MYIHICNCYNIKNIIKILDINKIKRKMKIKIQIKIILKKWKIKLKTKTKLKNKIKMKNYDSYYNQIQEDLICNVLSGVYRTARNSHRCSHMLWHDLRILKYN